MDKWMYVVMAVLAAGIGMTLFVAFILWYKGKLSDADFERVKEWVRIGVGAAEQIFGPKTGAQKKAYVISLLEAMGIEVNDKINALIEAMVGELNAKPADKEK